MEDALHYYLAWEKIKPWTFSQENVFHGGHSMLRKPLEHVRMGNYSPRFCILKSDLNLVVTQGGKKYAANDTQPGTRKHGKEKLRTRRQEDKNPVSKGKAMFGKKICPLAGDIFYVTISESLDPSGLLENEGRVLSLFFVLCPAIHCFVNNIEVAC
jgi:hypothetical protein